MKRLVACIAVCAVPFSASASPQLASDWGTRASELYQETITLLERNEAGELSAIPQQYETGVERFSVMAGRLGSWIDGNDGPSDLGCIFRGMAEEGEVQLMALDAADDMDAEHDSLKRLATMFSDAESIAAAASHAGTTDDSGARQHGPGSCAANLQTTRSALQ